MSTIVLKNYQEVLAELDKTRPHNHLLLGNGFNMSLGIKTDYKSICRQMIKNNNDYKSVMEKSLDSNAPFDLEDFIGACKHQIPDDQPYASFMKKFIHNKIKLDFMKATTQLVTTKVKNIYQEKNDKIYLLFKQFDTYFTLNYDPFLYQLLMRFKKDKIIVFRDSLQAMVKNMDDESQEIYQETQKAYDSGYGNIHIGEMKKDFNLNMIKKVEFKNELKLYFKGKYAESKVDTVIDMFWSKKDEDENEHILNPDDGFRKNKYGLFFNRPETENLYFLHGAFHIYHREEFVYKIKPQSDKPLYRHIEEIVNNDQEQILCVFSDKNKKDEILENVYLKNGFHALSQLSGTLMIHGSSLAENDIHIFNQIEKSNIDTIYISTCEKDKKKAMESAQSFFAKKKIVLFDYTTISFEK